MYICIYIYIYTQMYDGMYNLNIEVCAHLNQLDRGATLQGHRPCEHHIGRSVQPQN